MLQWKARWDKTMRDPWEYLIYLGYVHGHEFPVPMTKGPEFYFLGRMTYSFRGSISPIQLSRWQCPWRRRQLKSTWGSWQSKQSYETSCISVWVSAAKPDRLYPIFGFNQVGLGPRVQKRVRYGWPQKGSIIGFNPMMQIMQHCSSSWMPFNFLFSLTLDFVLVFNCFNAITLVPKRLYVCKL